MEIRSDEALAATLEDAFPGSRLYIEDLSGRFEVQLQQHGLLRPLSAAELSDGTLRYLLWSAALLTPRPPARKRLWRWVGHRCGHYRVHHYRVHPSEYERAGMRQNAPR